MRWGSLLTVGFLILTPTLVRAAPLYGAPEATLELAGKAAGDHFGYAVAVDGDTALVGAYGKGGLQGTAAVFTRSAGVWSQSAVLTPKDLVGKDAVGTSVALDGNTAVVGAPGQGVAWVFVRVGTTWSEQAKLAASDFVAGDRFGFSVAVAGNTAIVGAPEKDSRTGAVYVFSRSGTTWTQEARVVGKKASDRFGWAVAASGDSAVVGAPFYDFAIGRAYVLVRKAGVWSEQQFLAPPGGDEVTGAGFGLSVALRGDTALVGANGIGGETGAAYVLQRSGTTWSHQAKLSASDAKPGDNFGAVALGDDTAVVGAFHRAGNTGAAYVFKRAGTSWTQLPRLTAKDGVAGDLFGEAVACSGDTVLVGADARAESRGAAYAFRLTPTSAAGAACTVGVECASGYCADGRCCAKECAGAVCALDPDCPAGYRCVASKCVAAGGSACSADKTTSIASTGEQTKCAPYVCVDSPGTCRTDCTTTSDCAPSFVCDGSKCTPSPSSTTADDSGCAYASLSGGRAMGLLIAALALVGRGRRRR